MMTLEEKLELEGLSKIPGILDKIRVFKAIDLLGVEPWYDQADWNAVAEYLGPPFTKASARNQYRRALTYLEDSGITLEDFVFSVSEIADSEVWAAPRPAGMHETLEATEEPDDGRVPLEEYVDRLGEGVFRPSTVRLDKQGKVVEAYVRNDPEPLDEEKLRTIIGTVASSVPSLPRPPGIRAITTGTPHLFVPCVYDAHLEKIAQDRNVVWTPRAAGGIYLDVLTRLLDRGFSHYPSIDMVYLVVGQDFGHYDSQGGTTTAGTPVGLSINIEDAFDLRCQVATQAVLECVKKTPNVRVVVVPGNHDALLTYALGKVLEARFRTYEEVSVDTGHLPRKYARYGEVLLGFSHGDKEKREELPGLMAHEARKDWGPASYTEWLLGHFHTRGRFVSLGTTESAGVYLRFLPSLSPRDRWHAWRGYVDGFRAGEGLIYDRFGPVGEIIERV